MERDLRPILTRPPDFNRFWAKTREELRSVKSEVRLTPMAGGGLPESGIFLADIPLTGRCRGYGLQHRLQARRTSASCRA